MPPMKKYYVTISDDFIVTECQILSNYNPENPGVVVDKNHIILDAGTDVSAARKAIRRMAEITDKNPPCSVCGQPRDRRYQGKEMYWICTRTDECLRATSDDKFSGLIKIKGWNLHPTRRNELSPGDSGSWLNQVRLQSGGTVPPSRNPSTYHRNQPASYGEVGRPPVKLEDINQQMIRAETKTGVRSSERLALLKEIMNAWTNSYNNAVFTRYLQGLLIEEHNRVSSTPFPMNSANNGSSDTGTIQGN